VLFQGHHKQHRDAEAQHLAVLRHALGESPAPNAFIS